MQLKLANAIIEKVETRKDRSYKLVIAMPELPPEEAVKLFSCLNTEAIEVEMDTMPEDGGKSPSQRFRNVIYRLWEQEYQTKHKKLTQSSIEPIWRMKSNKVKDTAKLTTKTND